MTWNAWPANSLLIWKIAQLWKTPSSGRSKSTTSGMHRLEQRQEEPLGGLADVAVLHRRPADDRRRVDRVAAHRDRRHVEDREVVGERVVAGVVAERTLPAPRPARRSPRARSRRARAPRGRRSRTRATSTGSPRRMPANRNSSMLGGSGAVAAYVSAGSAPSATATSSRPPASRKFAAPSWCVWSASRSSARRRPAAGTCRCSACPRGSLVTTSGSVMNGPPSSGHVVSTGRRPRSGGSRTTSRNAAFLTVPGAEGRRAP